MSDLSPTKTRTDSQQELCSPQQPKSSGNSKQRQNIQHDQPQSLEEKSNFLSRIMMIRYVSILWKFIRGGSGVEAMLEEIRLKENYSSRFLHENFKQILENRKEEEEYTIAGIYKAILSMFKWDFIGVIFLLFLSLAMKIGNFVLLFYLFESMEEKNFGQAYLLAALVSSNVFIDYLLFGNYLVNAKMLVNKIKSSIIARMLSKVLSLTQFTASQEELGKVINMISNDFNIVDYKTAFLLAVFLFPIIYIASGVLLVIWLGPAGLITLASPLLLLPVLFSASKANSRNIEKYNVCKDKRVKIITDVVYSLKQIKSYGWEEIFGRKIKEIREKEEFFLKRIAAGRSAELTIANFGVIFGGFISLYIKSTTGDLTVNVIFTAFQIFAFLHFFNFLLVVGLSGIVDFNSIISRFRSILSIQNKTMTMLYPQNPESMNLSLQIPGKHHLVQFHDFSGFWNKNGKPILEKIDLSIEEGKFYGLCGSVSAGKSSLIQAMIGELPYYTGSFRVCGEISYLEQDPTLFDLTIKQNIVFGSKFQANRYRKVIEACCLIKDLKQLEKGDETMVGECGIMLSGGQKARVALARALYKDADLYIFDDPFSALDSKVGKKLFQNVFLNYLKGKTVILSTHHIHFLTDSDYNIELHEGRIIDIKKGINGLKEELEQGQNPQKSDVVEEKVTSTSIEAEAKLGVKEYMKYFFYQSKWKLIGLVLLFILTQGCYIAFLRVLSLYGDQKEGKFLGNEEGYWGLLGGILAAYFILLYLQFLAMNFFFISNNHKLHNDMVHRLLNCKSKVLDAMNSGTISNIFSNDIGILDNTLFFSLQEVFVLITLFILLVLNSIIIQPFFAIPAFLLIICLILFHAWSKQGLIISNHADLDGRTPIFTGLNQASKGLIQIKLFSTAKDYLSRFGNSIDRSFRLYKMALFCFKGIEVPFFYGATIVVLIGLMMGVELIKDHNDYALYSVSILNTVITIYRGASVIIFIEIMLISSHRCFQIIDYEQENARTSEEDHKIRALPNSNSDLILSAHALKSTSSNAVIVIENLRIKYREDLPESLKGITLRVQSGEKIGIVGRTGSGKSSIIQAILRMYEPQAGTVYEFYGADALKLGLSSLRSEISLIPQNPFIFKATIRDNLDPEHTVSDPEIMEVAKRCMLQEKIASFPSRLDEMVENPAELFSFGEKQLFCLARAMIRKCKVLILDEATSNIDKQTDELVQKILRQRFWSQTLITIAHRISTIADYDRVVVMEGGRISEEGSPQELIGRRGLFYEMAMHGEGQEVIEIARRSFEQSRGRERSSIDL